MYLVHIQNVIADTIKKNDKATLEGERQHIAKTSMLLKYSTNVDILELARPLSLVNQKTNEVDTVDKTLKKCRSEESDVTAMSMLLTVIEEESLSVLTQEHQYQGIVRPECESYFRTTCIHALTARSMQFEVST